MKMKFKRVFHHWEKCEEYQSQMWKVVPIQCRESYVLQSAQLMQNVAEFELAMKRAIDEWPYSCEATLTAGTMNHQAWMGHAGCAINHNAPEDLTRLAWRSLSKDEQDLANLAADNAIQYWQIKYSERLKVK
jgi:hypothetical protein